MYERKSTLASGGNRCKAMAYHKSTMADRQHTVHKNQGVREATENLKFNAMVVVNLVI